MTNCSVTSCTLGVAAAIAFLAWTSCATPLGAQAGADRVDYLTFAQGAVPVGIGGAGATLGANMTHALRVIDGNPAGGTIVSRANAETDVEFTYVLPAPTTFDRLAVPNVLETPSPSQTFFARVEVHGSAESATAGFVRLAAADLRTHERAGLVTELAIEARLPVRWVTLRLRGGIDMARPAMFLEFSEVVGNGTQEPAPFETRFTGAWRGRGVRLDTTQNGAVVKGCYGKTPSLFILTVTADGSILGVRSSNGAPFQLYAGAAAPAGTAASCPAPPVTPGCGAIIHGIQFAFDSATLEPASEPVLGELHKGLAADTRRSITIEGHTSSEGTEAYNRGLSERRAESVRADLIRRGLEATRLRAAGVGESRPMATNDDESGRAMNRRVEVHCQ
jgi:outer membrane protein OmpA-like peptidoglycan-associated protein